MKIEDDLCSEPGLYGLWTLGFSTQDKYQTDRWPLGPTAGVCKNSAYTCQSFSIGQCLPGIWSGQQNNNTTAELRLGSGYC